MSKELLDVVDESGNPVAVASREQIHREGLLHREIHVWLFTSDGKIIFQHRAKNKDTWPDRLDASVGGHVDLHQNFEATALKELLEETGIVAKPEDLQLLTQVRTNVFDPSTHTTNNVLRRIYALRYDGPPEKLNVEDGAALGFEAYPIEQLFHLSADEARNFIPLLVEGSYLDIYRSIQKLL